MLHLDPRCARHHGALATATCTRCGDNACPECLRSIAPGEQLCATCAQFFDDLRTPLLKHEERVLGIMYLHYLAAWWQGLWGGLLALAQIGVNLRSWAPAPPLDTNLSYLNFALVIVLASLNALIGWGLKRHKPWSRWLGIAVAIPCLIRFPFGTLANSWVLFVLCSPDAKRTLSTGHAEIVRMTPGLSQAQG